jgi:ribonuclease III
MRSFTELQQRISYTFGDPRLLERALTHRSYANEHRLSEHNERLEFLGDSVLNLVVSQRLMEDRPRSSEGELSRLRASVVSEPSLAEVARSIGIGDFLLLGKGEEQTGGRNKDSLLANSLEALVASLYLDGGFLQAASFIERSFRDIFERVGGTGGTSDYKTEFQELLKTLPEYRVVSESGPDHRKEFEIELTVRGEVLGRGAGRNKKEAEQKAAKEALEKLGTRETGDGSR